MSEEKLYAVKNDEGKYWDFGNSGFWRRDFPDCLTTSSRKKAGLLAFANDGYVVTFVEEPEKVVLTKEQAEIVERARNEEFPATYISDSDEEDEELLMNAYINGYTVEKEKKYGVWVPHVNKMYYKDGSGSDGLNIASADFLNDKNQQFTETEIEHYGLQDCKKEEVKMNE